MGDVAGMGSDIFESYVGSMIATIAIASTLAAASISTLAPGMSEGDGRATLMFFTSGSGLQRSDFALSLVSALFAPCPPLNQPKLFDSG